ncbi:nucleotide exchange factor GrpE [Candidatus Dojkabacteria bacterium]|nr:nucleotide exchange factor GrpE [Candidatus Dojkabacteria bacterium]
MVVSKNKPKVDVGVGNGDVSSGKQGSKSNQGKNAERNEEKIQELENSLKKALSDYQNLRKDMEKRLDFEEKVIRSDLLRKIIDLADDIDVAVDHVEDEKGWREGITQILSKFRLIISEMGGEIIDAKEGDKFNADLHEAVGIVCEGKDGHIAKVVQNGYKLGDMVVRPARVLVNKGQPAPS